MKIQQGKTSRSASINRCIFYIFVGCELVRLWCFMWGYNSTNPRLRSFFLTLISAFWLKDVLWAPAYHLVFFVFPPSTHLDCLANHGLSCPLFSYSHMYVHVHFVCQLLQATAIYSIVNFQLTNMTRVRFSRKTLLSFLLVFSKCRTCPMNIVGPFLVNFPFGLKSLHNL